MPTLAKLHRSLVGLLKELAAAVRAGDRVRATQLAQAIQRYRSATTADKVSSLMAGLEQSATEPPGHTPKRGFKIFPTPSRSSKSGNFIKESHAKANCYVRVLSSSKKSSSKTNPNIFLKVTPQTGSSKSGIIVRAGSKSSGSKVAVRSSVGHPKARGPMAVRFTRVDLKAGSSKVVRIAGCFTTTGPTTPTSPMDSPKARLCPPAGRKVGMPKAGKPQKDGVVYPVWFGTNRKLDSQGCLSSQPHTCTIKGRVDVYIPKAHRFGETGNGFWKRFFRLDLRDDRLRLQNIQALSTKDFFTEINQLMQIAREKGETPHALFFLHGFNVTFEEAAIRAAQIGCDLKVSGATAFFSWPSVGDVSAYAADVARIEASEGAITDFLVDFSTNCGAEKVHIIAHSMGNRGLLRVLQRIAGNAETRGKVKFGQIFLAAPDVDRALFIDLAHLYPEHAERTTLYASDGDKAVHLSATLHEAPRAGYYTPYTVVPGVDTVAVPGFDIDLLGHSYYAQAEALLHDIHDLMRHGEAPDKRQRIEPAACDGVSYWKFRR